MTQPKILFLNGPPGSGKDLCATILAEHHEGEIAHLKFADPLKNALCGLFSITRSWLENNKETPFFGDHEAHSYRELLITLSEDFAKPLLGEAFFGKALVKTIEEHLEIDITAFVISDSGFAGEAAPVLTAFGRENCALARVYRANHDFAGDSRAYWEPRDDKLKCFDIINNTSVDALTAQLNQEILPWLQS